MVAALPPEGGCGTSLGSQSLPAAPLSLVWHRSRPPQATWSQLQEEPRPSLTARSNQRADQEALASVRVPSHLEPSGISCVDGKRPDGATVMPWRCGQAWYGMQLARIPMLLSIWPLLPGRLRRWQTKQSKEDRKVCPPQY